MTLVSKICRWQQPIKDSYVILVCLHDLVSYTPMLIFIFILVNKIICFNFRHNRFGYPVYPEKQFGLPSPSGPVSFSGVSTVSQGMIGKILQFQAN